MMYECSKYPVKASNSRTEFLCVVCFQEFSCAHQGEVDVKRNILTKTHKDKALSLQQHILCSRKRSIDFFKFSWQKFSWPIYCWKQFFDCYSWQMWPIVKKICPQIRKLQNGINVWRLKLFVYWTGRWHQDSILIW